MFCNNINVYKGHHMKNLHQVEKHSSSTDDDSLESSPGFVEGRPLGLLSPVLSAAKLSIDSHIHLNTSGVPSLHGLLPPPCSPFHGSNPEALKHNRG
ncbi:hypothetical protein ACET3Z_017498 [Daucus carota]